MRVPNPNLLRFIRPARLQLWCARHGVLTGRWSDEDIKQINWAAANMRAILIDDIIEDDQALLDRWATEVPYKGDPGCWWHGPEPIPEGAYKVCGECWHCWPTAADFEADAQKMIDEIGGMTSPWPGGLTTLTFCPLCSHDF